MIWSIPVTLVSVRTLFHQVVEVKSIMSKKLYKIGAILLFALGLGVTVVAGRALGDAIWIPLALFTGILLGGFLFSVFKDFPRLHTRQPILLTVISGILGVFLLICLWVIYIVISGSDPPQWLQTAFFVGLFIFTVIVNTKSRWAGRAVDSNGLDEEDQSLERQH